MIGSQSAMETQTTQAPRFIFGPFEYDEISGALRKHGVRIRLHGKPLQILSLLANRPGQIISRDELQRHLWDGSTFVDFEQGLNSAVNKLRRTLGDSADQARYVETLPGQGYRFIAPIQRASNKAVSEMAAPVPFRIEPKPSRQPQSWGLFVAAMTLAVVAGGSYWLAKRSAEPVKATKGVRFAVVPLTGFAFEGAASRQSFALSPDGTSLAFTAMDSSGAFRVFLRDFNSLEQRLVPNSEGAHTLFWAPDGRSLFLTVQGKLWRTPLEGDAHVLLADSPSFMFSGAWLSPERLLLDGFQGSYLVSPSGGPLKRLNEIYWWPQMLPDGEHVLYLGWDARAGRHRTRVLRFGDFSTTKDLIETDSRVLYTAATVTPSTAERPTRRGTRHVQLDYAFDRLRASKLAHAYEMLVPVRARPLEAFVRERVHADGGDLRSGLLGAAARGAHDCEPDGGADRVGEDPHSRGAEGVDLR